MSARLITLTTDFGERGGYVGVMKGVIYTLQPAALIVDLTHEVGPQRVREGAFLLHSAYRQFPPGTIHVAVVDPGVGTARRGLCLDVPGVGRFVGPDNGLFSYVLDAHPELVAREIANPAWLRQPVSRTFHGRDVFAPVAARLSRGEPIEGVGPAVAARELVRLDNLWPAWAGRRDGARELVGEVVHVDRFGNLISNIPRDAFADLPPESLATVEVEVVGHRVCGIAETYGQAAPGDLIALFGSGGFLEVARVNGRAARRGDSGEDWRHLGERVAVELKPDAGVGPPPGG
jgi:S-adenosyl-L-methionine hydrolase (adenosine-forming)